VIAGIRQERLLDHDLNMAGACCPRCGRPHRKSRRRPPSSHKDGISTGRNAASFEFLYSHYAMHRRFVSNSYGVVLTSWTLDS
jgi:hypothetical protein